MIRKAYKLVTVLVAISLVLGLFLVACAPATPAPAPEPAPAPAPEPAPAPAPEPEPAPAPEPEPAPAPAPEPEPTPAPPPATGDLPFEATQYCNDEFGFCIQYPSDWVWNESIITVPEIHKAAFSVEGFVPGVACMVFDKPEVTDKDWLVSSFKMTGSTMPKVTSDITEITLSDGSPAYAFTAGYVSSTGYEVKSYCVDAPKGDKQIRINCYTVDAFEPYNEEVQSAVAKSLTLE